jgi:catechol-2,3-dioxygenase
MVPVTRLNHAVLFVRTLDRAADFYKRVFGLEEIAREAGMMAFLRARGSKNHHDLGLMAVGPDAPRPPRGSTGLYHLAWEVPTIEDLAAARIELATTAPLSRSTGTTRTATSSS